MGDTRPRRARAPRGGAGRRLVLLIAGVLAALAGPAAAFAADPVNLSSEQVRQRLFVAGDIPRLSDPVVGTRDLVLEAVLQEMYRRDPNLAAADAVAAIRPLDTQLDARLGNGAALRSLSPNEVVFTVLAGLSKPFPVGAAAPGLVEVMGDALGDAGDGGEFEPNADDQSTLAIGAFSAYGVVSATVALAVENPRFRDARDQLWAGESSQKLTDSVAQLRSRNPVFDSAEFAPAAALIGSDGTVHTDTATGEAKVSEAVAAMNQVGDAAIVDAHNPAGTETERLARAAERLRAIDARQAAAVFSGSVDPSERRVKVMAVITAVKSLSSTYAQWSTVAYKFSDTNQKMRALGSAGAAGNVLMAVGMLAMTWMNSGPSPEQLILEEIAKLREQVEQLRQEMAGRFDEVENKLAGLSSHLQVIEAKVSNLDHDVKDALLGINELKVQLDRLEANLLNANADDRAKELWEEAARTLGYAQRHDGLPLTRAAFDDADAFYYAHAQTADDSTALGGIRSFGPADVFAALSRPFEQNVDYLRRWPKEGGPRMDALWPDTVVNPRQWAMAARAYSQLLHENPDLVGTGNRSRLAEMISDGQEMRYLVQSIRAGRAVTPPDESTGSVLFDRLLDRYSTQKDALDTALAGYEADFVAGRSAPGPGNVNGETIGASTLAGLNLWGGGAQETADTDRPRPTKALQHCDPNSKVGQLGGTIDPPANLNAASDTIRNALPPASILAWRLGLATLDACWKADWNGASPGHDPDTRYSEPFIANMTISIVWTLRYPGGVTRAAGVSYGVVGGCYDHCDHKSADTDIFGNETRAAGWEGPILDASYQAYKLWKSGDGYDADGEVADQHDTLDKPDDASDDLLSGYMKARWESGVASQMNLLFRSPAAPAAVAADNVKALASVQKALYNEIADVALNTGAVGEAAKTLSGTKALLSSYLDFAFRPELASDDTLLSLQSGALYGATNVGDWYRSFGAMPVADLAEYSWDFNPRINLFKQAVLKAGDLRTHLRAHIGAAAGAPLGTVPDGGTLVDSTLNRLAVTQAVVQYEPPATGGGDPTDGGGDPTDGGGGATDGGGGGGGGGGDAGGGSGGGATTPGGGGGTTVTPPAPAELRLTAKLAKARFPGRKGTKLALGVSERARVTIKLVRSAKGRRAGKRCVARGGRGKACSLVLERRTLTVSVAPGAAPVAFGRKLRRGGWSGTAVAVDGSGRRSKPIIFRFTVA